MSALRRGVERADIPSLSSLILSGTLREVMLADAWTVRAPALVSVVTPILFRDTSAAASSPAPHRPAPVWALDHVGCHASRSMRRRICPNRRRVNWLSA